MKRILISGKDSYIGKSLESWLAKDPDSYQVETIDVRDESWQQYDFSGYDTVFHVAGIAHIKETKKNASLYYKVNRDLAYAVAKRASEERVAQFIFLSSMSVFGMETGIIDGTTPTNPTSHYGKSKLEAERLIESLKSETFQIAILRPPMVYGKGCKGNYQKLVKLALITPVFPDIDNKRSMIYIDNLCAFIVNVINKGSSGVFFPQNREYVNTTELVKLIAELHGKNIIVTKSINHLLVKFTNRVKLFKKIFGTLIYEREMSMYPFEQSESDAFFYTTITFEESVRLS